MKRLFLVVGTAIVILPWLAGARAQADAIHWTASGSAVGPDGGNWVGVDGGWSRGGIDLIDGPKTSGSNSGSIVLTTLSAFDANVGTPHSETAIGFSANYQVTVELRDLTSWASGSLTFGGNINADFGINWADITNTFLGPTTQSLKLGKNLYTVTVGPFVPPGAPTDPITGTGGAAGSISASIAVQPVVNSAPEPSSMVLACLGLPSLGLARWFRRKVGDSNASKA